MILLGKCLRLFSQTRLEFCPFKTVQAANLEELSENHNFSAIYLKRRRASY